jgi:hypothetical protein
MNNEPVAWITPPENVWTSCLACGQKVTNDSVHTCSPQLKTLTDEEINAEMLAYLNSKTMGLEDFAKAILRKAQEK